MNIFVKNREGRPRTRDLTRRAWSMPVTGAPAIYRARTWPYKGRRTLVKTYPS